MAPSEAPPPVPQVGDVICGTQEASVTVVHHYNLPWGEVEPDEFSVAGARFCVEVVGVLEPDWLELRFTEFAVTLPSFVPHALPDFETGLNHIVLGTVPSRGKFHQPTGTVFAELNLQLTNTLFSGEYPIRIRGGIRGTFNLADDEFTIDAMSSGAMTPVDYHGVVPLR